MATLTPGPHTHEQWLGLVQPVGLVVAPAVLSALQLFPNQSTPYLSARQRQLEGLLEEVEGPGGQPLAVVPSFALLSTDLLDWGDADLVAAAELQAVPEVVLAEYGETLRPSHGVPKFEGEGLQALVLDLTQWHNAHGQPDPQWGRDFDANWNPTGHGWDATPQQRFERLLKETEIPIGLLFNGSQLRLVHAPRGESSGWLTMPLEPMAEVAGRPMLGALELLLGVDRLFGGNPEQRLPAVLVASRKNQNEVSTRLAEQVLEALWELLLGFDEAERIAREASGTVLGQLPNSEEGQKHLYGGLITVLLRLVFLLYAEDEALMPADSLYGQHYSVSALADRLRQDRFEHQGAMADRRGAWASLLSLFRLVYDGGGSDPAYLPARHGELFDPDAYPFLEGRKAGSSYKDDILTNLPAISDDVVEKVLTRLLWLADESKVAQRLNYRSLDVEQIGSVYEGIMGFTVEGASGPSVGITYRPPRQKITITLVVDAEQLLQVAAGKREKWLDEQAGVALKLPAKAKEGLKQATSLAELCLALGNRLSPHTPNGLATGSLILQPTAERRRSGSHYTPRALTEPIVAEAFRPWLERCNHKPTAEQILALKVCDPAMGSGAFLVAVCRYLAGWLVQAWDNGDAHKAPKDSSLDKDLYARRLIAQSCLYGVDKNPFAVNLAKLSLWLVTLSQDLPFTFVDHALKCGDSLVGYSLKEIEAASENVQLQLLRIQQGIYVQACAERCSSFADDTRSDEDYDRKRIQLHQQIKASEGLRQAGDLMVAAFFEASKPKDRADKQEVYLSMLSGAFDDEGLQESIQEIRDRLAAGEKGITPFNWDLEFPEVFGEGRGGFDAFVGNPPFIAKNLIASSLHHNYPEWLAAMPHTNGKSDLSAFFFRKCHHLTKEEGTTSLIATKTISQGDTRACGLAPICIHEHGFIYSTQRNKPWPGAAAVRFTSVHVQKGIISVVPRIDGIDCVYISAFLRSAGPHSDPYRLASNRDRSFQGCNLSGQGFIFSDATEGSSPLSVMREIISQNPESGKVINPYISGSDVNTLSDLSEVKRYAFGFGRNSLEESELLYPELVAIARKLVKPDRESRPANKQQQYLADRWWQWHTDRPSMQLAVRDKGSILVNSQATAHVIFRIASKQATYAHTVNIFAVDTMVEYGCLQSLAHQAWARLQGSSLGSTFRYTPTDCFETYPFPSQSEYRPRIDKIAEEYHSYLASLCKEREIGPTGAMNIVSSPFESRETYVELLRDCTKRLSRAVLDAYGWRDIDNACGFCLKPSDITGDESWNDEVLEIIERENIFFASADQAVGFAGQLKGLTGGTLKLSWEYGWTYEIREEVLARLLALNAERYEEEVAMGLHSKGAKKTVGAQGGRKPKSDPPTNQSSFQIEPEPLQMNFDLLGGR